MLTYERAKSNTDDLASEGLGQGGLPPHASAEPDPVACSQKPSPCDAAAVALQDSVEPSSSGAESVRRIRRLLTSETGAAAIRLPAVHYSEAAPTEAAGEPWSVIAAFEFFGKRAIDIAGSAFGLLVSSPLWALLWVVNRAFGDGPLLYTHNRVGKDGMIFRCYKFRTMVASADRMKTELATDNEHADPRTFKIRRDPRITPVGWWLRKFSLDELPQLLNILNGDMSLVGPRPPLPAEVELYSEEDWRRLAVKPGLTCIWQVSGRSNLPFERQLEMDLEYIQKQSLWFDLMLILRTVPAVLSCKGAY
ncbi:putative sugar transferase EpsL [Pseudobythopirellula maris]|uniref:Putative sugar transferase EpsL n=1 Tax=Pseudobythopirellula maris TaxID=2527991 RepID=A0A5C5ZL49_9BACT|nr:sugar transferase [Pseudobythopirellula maris]TWT87531.1 putative sugar transferase EpsL [Pseudobythopirellula maris]